MKPFSDLTKAELEALRDRYQKEYNDFKSKGLKLDISRGKPAKAQLDLVMPMLDILNSKSEVSTEKGVDCRNYGILEGIPECRKLMADIMGVAPENTLVFGNASLNIMYDQIARSFLFGILGNTPWSKLPKIQFLCPVPGYDRHFGMTEEFGIEMINIPMNKDGPDMDMVETLVGSFESIKGIWCIPKYSNPGGIVYSDEVVRRLASMKPKAKDFRIYWDNAYCIHHLYPEKEKQAEILNILDECKKAGNEDMVYQFCSTSKVTFPGAGVAALSTSLKNIEDIKKRWTFQTIGHDKINQLRHVKFLKDMKGVEALMMKQAEIIRPKFDAVLNILEQEIAPLKIANWNHPLGGYFISFNATKGCAKKIYQLCKEAGLTLTGAGAAFPYKKDPNDSNIRIAPTLPPLDEIKVAMALFAACVKLATVEKYLEKK